MRPILSVIIVTFNNFDELIKTIKSIPKFNWIEIVVVNGGQCQTTIKFLQNNPAIRSRSEKDKGISDAFNKGFKDSNGEFFVYINSGDNLISNDYIEKSVKYLQENPLINYTYSNIILDHPHLGHYVAQPKLSNHPGMPFCHQSLITRKSIITKSEPFDIKLRYAMDFDFYCRFLDFSNTGKYFEIESIFMDGSGRSSTQPTQVYFENLQILKRYNKLSILKFLKLLRYLVTGKVREILSNYKDNRYVQLIFKSYYLKK